MCAKKIKKRIYVGTSGWNYDNWFGKFYPEDISTAEMLEYYSGHFNTVEINNTFYNLPKDSTFKNWAKKTPEDFVFTVKASRYITHMKKLKDSQQPFLNLEAAASNLGKKLTTFLFQLPANQKKDFEKLKNFIAFLPKKYNHVFEFRDESWFDDKIYELLDKNKCSIVISSSPEFPYHEIVTGGIFYLRMHGKKSLYKSKYSDDELKGFAKITKKYYQNGNSAYIYFNNDAMGYAVENARTLKNMLYST